MNFQMTSFHDDVFVPGMYMNNNMSTVACQRSVTQSAKRLDFEPDNISISLEEERGRLENQVGQ